MSRRWDEQNMLEARRLFVGGGTSVHAISRATGIPGSTLRARARRDGWAAGPEDLPSLEDGPDEAVSGPSGEAPTVSVAAMADRRRDLAERALAVAERHMQHIEARLTRGLSDVAEEERGARVLAVVIRSLRELAALEQRAGRGPDAPGGEVVRDEPAAVRNADEIRADFARRLETLFGNGNLAALS